MAINTNIGPERVEVTLNPIGTVLPQGAATARTAVLLATDYASAPLNTPITVTSLAQFESLFGDISNMGEVYLNVQGYYQNAGVGTELVVVAVEPSGVAGSPLEVAQNQDARSIVGSLAKILDDGVMNEDIVLTSYTASTGVAVLDLTGATLSDLSNVKVGDYLVDDENRFFAITSVGVNKVTIQSGLDSQLTKSEKSVSADAATGLKIVRLYSEGKYSGKTCIQEGSDYGVAITVTVSEDMITSASFDHYLNNVKVGDIITDSASEEFIIIDVIDGNNLQVDRSGMTAGAVTFTSGIKTKIVQSTKDAGAVEIDFNTAPISASAGEIVFSIADSATYPAKSSLVGKFIKFADDSQAEIIANSIVASNASTITALASASVSYTASTGIVVLDAGETVIADGAKAGDVYVDSLGKEFVIHEVVSETSIRIDKNIASPNPLAGAKISKGLLQMDLAANADFSAKVSGEPSEDITGAVHSKANSLVFASGTSLDSDDYFIMTPAVQASDYVGSEADESGLYALEAVSVINIVTIPGVYDPSVQAALADYCSITRFDCMSLLSIPEFISTASNDSLVASNLSISTVVDSENGVVITFTGSPDLSQVSAYDILSVGSSKFTIRAVSDEDDQIVLVQTTGVPLTGSVSIASPSAVSWKDTIINKPSTKASWYYNHLAVSYQGDQYIVDPVLHVAGIMNRIDRNVGIGGVSHAPAGIQYAQIAGIIGLQLQISEKKDGGPLRLAYINRITESTGNGRYVFGGYTAGGNSVTPDEKLIQVMRSLMFIKNSLEPGLIGFLWENNSPVNRQNIANTVLAFLRANAYLFPAGLPEDQQFQVSLVPPTQEDIDQGLVRVTVKVRINSAIRFIDIDLAFPIPQAEA